MLLAFQVTIVVPIFNEVDSLPVLLMALKAQTKRPEELIFVDAGSTDGSVGYIETWWSDEGWEGASCQVLKRPGAMPGYGRNAGVRASTNQWIAFLDGGIAPASDWLEQLCRHAHVSKAPAVFGVCHFSAITPFAKAVCSLSYGHGSVHPVIPASLFSLRVFDEVGHFPAHLRAGEDLVWMVAFQKYYGVREICKVARVSYTYFPVTWLQAFSKWRVTELHCVLAGVRNPQHVVYLFGLPTLYFFALCGGSDGLAVFVGYVTLRGVIDPFRRSSDRPWWGAQLGAAMIAPALVVVLDLAKWVGIFQGLGWKVLRCWKWGKRRHADG